MKIMISTRTITQENASIATSVSAWNARALLVVSSAMNPLTISSTHLPFASNASLTNVSTARALLVVSSATKPRIISSTHPPSAKNAHLIIVLIAKISPTVPNAMSSLTISSINLQVSASFVKYRAVWIVSTTTTVPHVTNP